MATELGLGCQHVLRDGPGEAAVVCWPRRLDVQVAVMVTIVYVAEVDGGRYQTLGALWLEGRNGGGAGGG